MNAVHTRCLLLAAFALTLLLFGISLASVQAQAPPAVTETHFSLWARTPGSAVLTPPDSSGAYQITATKTGDASDWSLASDAQTPVQPDTLMTLGAWIKCRDGLPSRLDVVERDAGGSVLDWQYAPAVVAGTQDWKYVVTRFVPQAGVASVQARLEGDGAGTYWVRGMSLTATPLPRPAWLANHHFGINNGTLDVQVAGASGAIGITPVDGSPAWWQFGDRSSGMIVTDAALLGRLAVRLTLLNAINGQTYAYTVRLPLSGPKVEVTLAPLNTVASQLPLAAPIAFPPPFEPLPGDALVVPNNEGVLYPADDQSVVPYDMPLYGGHSGLSMPWYGIVQNGGTGAGLMTVVNSPDDATLSLRRRAASMSEANGAPEQLLEEQPVWEAQKGKFGYARDLVYIVVPRGGYVAQAKVYRAIAKSRGLLVTLAAKRRVNPNVDKLVGAVDVWDFESGSDALAMAQNLKAAGAKRILWSQREPGDVVRQINALGFLTGAYDIYQDVYEPSAPHSADHPEWHPQADHWPGDLVLDESGKPVVSWVDHATNADGSKVDYDADACCSIPGLTRAKREIPADLRAHPFAARFIDTITASPWRECYSLIHPTTRTVDKQAKMALLKYVSGAEGLVCGSETGIDCAVPYEDYFEGMMSLARYRQPNSGYNLTEALPPTPDFLKYQVGTRYRVPLFELVYHDCMVTTWYWGDSSNVEADYWDKRDLWNILYGTSPLFILDKTRWRNQSARFTQTIARVCPALRRTAYAEMVGHRFVTPDGSVQETRWSNGVVVRVDFADSTYAVTSR